MKLENSNHKEMSVKDVAMGFIKVANDLEVIGILGCTDDRTMELAKESTMEAHEKENGNYERVKQRQASENTLMEEESSDTMIVECPECKKDFKDKSDMLTHCRSKHGGIRYPCNLCDFQATLRLNLMEHMHSKHDSFKYPCNQYEYEFTTAHNLHMHIEKEHVDIQIHPKSHRKSM